MRPGRRIWVMIVLSVTWAIGAGIHTHNADVERAENFAKFAYKTCTYGKEVHHNPDLSSCDAERAKNLKTWMDGTNANVAVASLAPIPFAWLAAFILPRKDRCDLVRQPGPDKKIISSEDRKDAYASTRLQGKC